MTDKFYILTEDHRIVPEPDLTAWALWFASTERHVAKNTVGPYWVSTVFLGLDHDHKVAFRATNKNDPKYRPLIFETMVFLNDKDDGRSALNFMRRYRSWDDALAGHVRTVLVVARMLRWAKLRKKREA